MAKPRNRTLRIQPLLAGLWVVLLVSNKHIWTLWIGTPWTLGTGGQGCYTTPHTGLCWPWGQRCFLCSSFWCRHPSPPVPQPSSAPRSSANALLLNATLKLFGRPDPGLANHAKVRGQCICEFSPHSLCGFCCALPASDTHTQGAWVNNIAKGWEQRKGQGM